MTVAKNLDAYEQGETPSWAWPVHAFIAWLATMLGYITRFKRIRHTQRFKSNWPDNWDGLRESEWHRDQLIAQGVEQLLAGRPIHLDDTKTQLTPPATYGGRCPHSPFEMNRRFIALARWAADPEAIIRARFKRLSRSLIAANGSTDARSAATHQAVTVVAFGNTETRVTLMVRATTEGSARRTTTAVSPVPVARHKSPDCPLRTANCLSAPARLRTPPRAATKPRTCASYRNPL